MRLLLLFLFFCVSLYAKPTFDESIQYQKDGENLIGYLHIGKERGIDQSTYLYVKFALEEFKAKKVPFVILHLNTPGGEVFSSLKISELLQKLDSEDHIPVVAFIDNWALSAGAMLAYSSRFIGIVNVASMGAAEPITMGEGGKMESAPEKINSALRAEIANLARLYGRDPLIAQAMVDKDIILVKRREKIVQVQREEEILATDEVITQKGKLLTLNAEQLRDLGIADFMAKSVLDYPFFAKIPQVKLVTYENWKVGFFAFLAHPLVSSLLMMGLLIGVYMEVNHPGFGFPAILGLSCLGLILISSFAVHTVHFLELIMLGVGLILLLVEVFILPGFGVTGILGILFTIGGLFALMLPSFRGANFSFDLASCNAIAQEILRRLAWLSSALLASAAAMIVLSRAIIYKSSLFRRLILSDSLEENRTSLKESFYLNQDQEGYLASNYEATLVGKSGTVFSELKPAGHITVDGVQYVATSESGFIEKGEEVLISGGRGANLIVIKKG